MIARAIRTLIQADEVAIDRDAINAGLAILDAGGDFADGVIAFEGQRLGAEVFVSFDRKAIRLVNAQGSPTRLLLGAPLALIR